MKIKNIPGKLQLAVETVVTSVLLCTFHSVYVTYIIYLRMYISLMSVVSKMKSRELLMTGAGVSVVAVLLSPMLILKPLAYILAAVPCVSIVSVAIATVAYVVYDLKHPEREKFRVNDSEVGEVCSYMLNPFQKAMPACLKNRKKNDRNIENQGASVIESLEGASAAL